MKNESCVARFGWRLEYDKFEKFKFPDFGRVYLNRSRYLSNVYLYFKKNNSYSMKYDYSHCNR